MPRNKDLKRLVRARMNKTGEAYTAARAQITRTSSHQSNGAAPAPVRATNAPAKPDYAALAGRSDAVLKEKTGCTWERWVAALDGHGAASMPHREIAALVNTKYKIDGWWAQSVAVGYERIKGLRAIGQRRNGAYEASKSRTFNVPVDVLFDAWSDARKRKRWLRDALKVRMAKEPKAMRFDGPDRTIIIAGFESKGAGKSVVSLTHTKLASKESANESKRYWTARLDALGDMFATK
jgi:hypothetical protein